MSNPSKFDLWIEYEKIAMHFNELLMQLRPRALAGVGAVVTLSGVFATESDGFNWTLIAFVSFFLLFIWIGIFVIDKYYYDRLLSGAVAPILELEKTAEVDNHRILMSTKIRDKVRNGRENSGATKAVTAFYFIVGGLLIFIFVLSLSMNGVLTSCGGI
ncbi:MAG: hypothetical protein ABJN22_09130 [Litorimonas sp.]